jgi:hypothetical protein
MTRRRKDKGYPPDPEAVRLAVLARRPLRPADVPNEPWQEDYGRYLLRADGVIESATVGALALVRADGTVAWYR